MLKEIASLLPPLRRIKNELRFLREENSRLKSTLNSTAASTINRKPPSQSVFYFYNTNLDATDIIQSHAVDGLQPTPDFLTNFLGVLIRPEYLPNILAERAGTVEAVPIPANWHADIAEWASALRAVDLSEDTFTVVELGCGWGCWINNTGVAARAAGRKVNLIGIEGDEGHVRFAKQCCADNKFRDDQVTIVHGIAAANAGTALFPRQTQAGVNWGLEPIFNATAEQRREAVSSGACDELSMVPLESLPAGKRIDLLHIDIQGGEADFVRDAIGTINKKVAYLLIGTHSREIEGRLFSTLREAGWILEIERPAILSVNGGVPNVTVDGVQAWLNPRLAKKI
ncbi:class I SAM-dependent methyltransferase [Bosea sp. SSUT16]|uniref:Class I SAM-dependent methyltransferase n=2 Tax=Bosea spartocytisi TaxID=2773451 RepID=A0A927EA68_9HYPH|nr:class I SAM-dependent methyltransferase [Bosea spartocytisi]